MKNKILAIDDDTDMQAMNNRGGRTYCLLGMTLEEIGLEAEFQEILSSKRGIAIREIDKDTGSYLAGVRRGDIIVEVNSEKVRLLNDLEKVLRLHDPRDPILVFLLNKCGVWRFINLSFLSGRS
jgi:S1-C subfamily serine protease